MALQVIEQFKAGEDEEELEVHVLVLEQDNI